MKMVGVTNQIDLGPQPRFYPIYACFSAHMHLHTCKNCMQTVTVLSLGLARNIQLLWLEKGENIIIAMPGSEERIYSNTPGTAGGPGGHDRTLAVKSRKGVSPKWVKSKRRRKNTPGTAGGPGGRDPTLAVKRRKNEREKKKKTVKK